jgi:hypothetical protein
MQMFGAMGAIFPRIVAHSSLDGSGEPVKLFSFKLSWSNFGGDSQSSTCSSQDVVLDLDGTYN